MKLNPFYALNTESSICDCKVGILANYSVVF